MEMTAALSEDDTLKNKGDQGDEAVKNRTLEATDGDEATTPATTTAKGIEKRRHVVLSSARRALALFRTGVAFLQQQPVAMALFILITTAVFVVRELAPVVAPIPYVEVPKSGASCDVEFTRTAFLAARQIPGTRCQRLDPPAGSNPEVCRAKVLEQVMQAGPSPIDFADADAEKSATEAEMLVASSDPRSSPAARASAEKKALEARKHSAYMLKARQEAEWRQGLSWTGQAIMHCQV